VFSFEEPSGTLNPCPAVFYGISEDYRECASRARERGKKIQRPALARLGGRQGGRSCLSDKTVDAALTEIASHLAEGPKRSSYSIHALGGGGN